MTPTVHVTAHVTAHAIAQARVWQAVLSERQKLACQATP